MSSPIWCVPEPIAAKGVSCSAYDTSSSNHNGSYPSLANLDDGDLKYTTDFRAVYATLLDKWLNADSDAVLNNHYDHLAFLGPVDKSRQLHGGTGAPKTNGKGDRDSMMMQS